MTDCSQCTKCTYRLAGEPFRTVIAPKRADVEPGTLSIINLLFTAPQYRPKKSAGRPSMRTLGGQQKLA